MQATEFEFRYRSWINLVHFWLAFQAYSIDHVNFAEAVGHWAADVIPVRVHLLVRLVFALGTVLVGLAAAVRTWAAAYLRSQVVHDSQLHTDTLVADGPYRHVRNPLYLGTFLFCVGMGFLASRLGFAILAGGAAIRILRLIAREEYELAQKLGESYGEFCRRVPRLVPGLAPRVPAGMIQPQWGQAFQGEAVMWGFFAGMAAYTLTLRARAAWAVFGVTLALWLVQKTSRAGGRKRR
jgi:protein-S-isoprenylcysteine O-methyltransferase Ste14